MFEESTWTSDNGVAYKIGWCDLCDCAYIQCPRCENISCNGGGCELCLADWEEFKKYKNSVEDYLSADEIIIYQKIQALKRKIPYAISLKHEKIDFKFLQKEGYLSIMEEEIFERELK